MAGGDKYGLLRVIGRWSLAALVVNSIIGSGIFALPADVARLVGRASPWAVLLAGAAAGIIMGCFAEVASQFSRAGGPYLYTRVAFGRLVGIEVGWMLWFTRVASWAARLGYAESQFVHLALQDALNRVGLRYTVTVNAA